MRDIYTDTVCVRSTSPFSAVKALELLDKKLFSSVFSAPNSSELETPITPEEERLAAAVGTISEATDATMPMPLHLPMIREHK